MQRTKSGGRGAKTSQRRDNRLRPVESRLPVLMRRKGRAVQRGQVSSGQWETPDLPKIGLHFLVYLSCNAQRTERRQERGNAQGEATKPQLNQLRNI